MKGFRQKLVRNKKTFDADTVPPQRTDSIATTTTTGNGANSIITADHVDNETPEAAAQRLVRTFCMSEVDEAGAEVALLPSIVEAAESSPQAATECARYIRKFLYRDYWTRPNFVYNAIMLMRILVENPGMTFTRNMDKKFVDTVRDLLRGCQHAHIVHFLIETLQDFESKGAVDEGIGRLVEMWQKEKAKSKSAYTNQPQQQQSQGGRSGLWHRPQPQMWQQPGPGYVGQGQYNGGQGGFVNQGGFVDPAYGGGQRSSSRGNYQRGHSSAATLPKPRELRKRLDEAKTTASVLADVVNTTTPAALLKHDLADDLSARCRRATNQVLEYMNTHDPIPDNHEMAALLATHEVLEQTLHHYHRAVLEARRSLGIGESRRTSDGNAALEMTPAGKGKANAPMSPVTGGPSGTNGGGSDSNGHSNGLESPRSGDETFGRNEDDDMIAAAIAASTAPGANSRGGRGGYGQQGEGSSAAAGASGSANEAENPFADNLPESSRSSSRVRLPYGGGGGGSSSAAAGGSSSAAGGAVAYVDSDNESDEEYLRNRRRNKAVADAGVGGSSSAAGGSGSGSGSRGSKAAAYGSGSGSGSGSGAAGGSSSSGAPPVPPASTKPGPASPRISAPSSPTGFDAGVGGSSSSAAAAGPAVDSEAGGSGGPVFRY